MAQRFRAAAETRLDKAIADATPLSRNRARKLVESGGVLVDGKRAKHSSVVVAAGSEIEIRNVPTKTKEESPLVERYRDEGILVVEKPAGLPTQATREGGRTPSLRNAPGAAPLRRPPPSARHASVGARARHSGSRNQRGRAREVRAARDPAHVRGGRDRGSGAEGSWTASLDGESAHTRFRRVATDGRQSVLEIELETGRMHQIRRHAAMAGVPVLGDLRYGGAAKKLWSAARAPRAPARARASGHGRAARRRESDPGRSVGALGDDQRIFAPDDEAQPREDVLEVPVALLEDDGRVRSRSAHRARRLAVAAREPIEDVEARS
jgi:ribosomal protein S4